MMQWGDFAAQKSLPPPEIVICIKSINNMAYLWNRYSVKTDDAHF
jgi:hypothetical protein